MTADRLEKVEAILEDATRSVHGALRAEESGNLDARNDLVLDARRGLMEAVELIELVTGILEEGSER